MLLDLPILLSGEISEASSVGAQYVFCMLLALGPSHFAANVAHGWLRFQLVALLAVICLARCCFAARSAFKFSCNVRSLCARLNEIW